MSAALDRRRTARNDESWTRRLARGPVGQTLAAMLLASVATWFGALVGLPLLFVLAPPVLSPPWTLVTSVYAHAGPGHLLSNAIVVAVAGSLVARSTTRRRFHAFFLSTGAVAGIAQVVAYQALGVPTAVLGASGAAFALVGYALVANPATGAIRDRIRLSARATTVITAAVAIGVTVLLSAPGSALVAHFVGGVLGLLSGRVHLLRA